MATLIATDRPQAVTQPVSMEVVAGARDQRRQAELTGLLQRFVVRRFDADVDSSAATCTYLDPASLRAP